MVKYTNTKKWSSILHTFLIIIKNKLIPVVLKTTWRNHDVNWFSMNQILFQSGSSSAFGIIFPPLLPSKFCLGKSSFLFCFRFVSARGRFRCYRQQRGNWRFSKGAVGRADSLPNLRKRHCKPRVGNVLVRKSIVFSPLEGECIRIALNLKLYLLIWKFISFLNNFL